MNEALTSGLDTHNTRVADAVDYLDAAGITEDQDEKPRRQ